MLIQQGVTSTVVLGNFLFIIHLIKMALQHNQTHRKSMSHYPLPSSCTLNATCLSNTTCFSSHPPSGSNIPILLFKKASFFQKTSRFSFRSHYRTVSISFSNSDEICFFVQKLSKLLCLFPFNSLLKCFSLQTCSFPYSHNVCFPDLFPHAKNGVVSFHSSHFPFKMLFITNISFP